VRPGSSVDLLSVLKPVVESLPQDRCAADHASMIDDEAGREELGLHAIKTIKQ